MTLLFQLFTSLYERTPQTKMGSILVDSRASVVIRYDTIRYIICTEKLTGKLPV